MSIKKYSPVETDMIQDANGEWVWLADVVRMTYKEWQELIRKYKEQHKGKMVRIA